MIDERELALYGYTQRSAHVKKCKSWVAHGWRAKTTVAKFSASTPRVSRSSQLGYSEMLLGDKSGNAQTAKPSNSGAAT